MHSLVGEKNDNIKKGRIEQGIIFTLERVFTQKKRTCREINTDSQKRRRNER